MRHVCSESGEVGGRSAVENLFAQLFPQIATYLGSLDYPAVSEGEVGEDHLSQIFGRLQQGGRRQARSTRSHSLQG